MTATSGRARGSVGQSHGGGSPPRVAPRPPQPPRGQLSRGGGAGRASACPPARARHAGHLPAQSGQVRGLGLRGARGRHEQQQQQERRRQQRRQERDARPGGHRSRLNGPHRAWRGAPGGWLVRGRAWDTVAPQERGRSCNGSRRARAQAWGWGGRGGGSAARRRSAAVPDRHVSGDIPPLPRLPSRDVLIQVISAHPRVT